MEKLPAKLITEYQYFIERQGVQSDKHRFYLQWLRYYFDFYHQYNHGLVEKESLSSFIKKREDKNQAEELRKQARHSVTLFRHMQNHEKAPGTTEISQEKVVLSS